MTTRTLRRYTQTHAVAQLTPVYQHSPECALALVIEHFARVRPALWTAAACCRFQESACWLAERTMRAFRRAESGSAAAGCEHESGSSLPQSKVESRFKSIAILNEEALLTTLAYVDLNPLAAGMAKTLEESLHTSVKARVDYCREQGTLAGDVGAKVHMAGVANSSDNQAPSSGLRPPSPPALGRRDRKNVKRAG